MPKKNKKDLTDNGLEGEILAPEIIQENPFTGSLNANSHNTVQPIALMRLGVFVPTLKSTGSKTAKKKETVDVSSELMQLNVAKAEGFNEVSISGSRLDMDSDFKTWIGIVRGLAEYGNQNGQVEMSLIDFMKYCGYPSSRIRKELRERVVGSLKKIMSTVISFQKTLDKKNDDGSNKIIVKMMHLISGVYYNEETDTISYQAETQLKELFQIDHKVLLQLKVIQKLPRKETAQALYTFIESLPANPAPVSLARLRARLHLGNKSISSQNQLIRKNMKVLEELGYLSFSEVSRGRTKYFNIHHRNPKLKEIAPLEEVKEPVQEKKDESNGPSHLSLIEAKIAELAKDMTPENIFMISELSKSLEILRKKS